MNQTLEVSSRNAGTDNGWKRGKARGLDDGRFEVVVLVDGLRDEDAVERYDDAAVVLDVRGEMVVVRFGRMVVILEVRVRHDRVATGTVRAVHVLHRGQRQAGQGGDEAQRDGAHYQH